MVLLVILPGLWIPAGIAYGSMDYFGTRLHHGKTAFKKPVSLSFLLMFTGAQVFSRP